MPWRHNAALWDADEVTRLRAWREAGLTRNQIAIRLGRSEKAVTAKLKSLGIYAPLRIVRPSQQQPRERHEPVQRAGAVTLPPLPSLSDE